MKEIKRPAPGSSPRIPIADKFPIRHFADWRAMKQYFLEQRERALEEMLADIRED